MKTEAGKRKVLWFGMALVLLVLLPRHGASVPKEPVSNDIANELIIPVLTKDTEIHISGSFTCDNSKDCFSFDGTPIIEIRAVVRLMDGNGQVSFADGTSNTIVALDQSDPSRRRLAFSGTLKGSDYLEQEPFRSVSLLLDAFGTQKGGAGDDNKTDNKSLGWLTAAAFVDINGDGLTVIAVQLNDPKPDACGIISRPIETK